MKKVKFFAKIPVSVFKEGKQYIAFSPVLDLSTSGKSEKQAKDRFAEIVEIFIEECYKADTIDQILSNLGWQKEKNRWQPPELISQRKERINIAFA